MLYQSTRDQAHKKYTAAEVMARHNYADELIHKIFWKNFYNFAIKNL